MPAEILLPTEADHDSGVVSPASRPGSPPRARLLALLVVAVVLLPFLPALNYGFTYDDEAIVLGNPMIRSWRFVPGYFASPLGAFYNPASATAYYRPLVPVWLRLNYAAFGTHALGWHLSAICVHLFATLALFFLLRRIFADSRIAAGAAMIFGIHPAHIESVAWVSGATDTLLVLSIFASLLLWAKNAESPRVWFRAGSLLCCAAALLVKETAVVLPLLVFAWACAMPPGPNRESEGLRGRIARASNEAAPYFVVTAAYLLVHHYVVRGLPARTAWVSLRDTVLTAPSLLLWYLRHLVWPGGLAIAHDFPLVTTAASAQFWIPCVILAALVVAVWRLWAVKRNGALPLAFAWILLPLLPVLDIRLFQPDDFVHDRYLYLPVVGLAMLAGTLLAWVKRRSKAKRTQSIATMALIVVLVALGASTIVQARQWKDDLALYTHAVETAPKNTVAGNNLASEYAALNRPEEAASLLESVLAERPDYWLANYNYGYVNYKLRRLDVAERFLRRAIALDPSDADEHVYLGLTLFREGRIADAISEEREGIRLRPDGVGYHVVLGSLLEKQGDTNGAAAEYLQELRYHPGSAAARMRLAAIEQRLNK